LYSNNCLHFLNMLFHLSCGLYYKCVMIVIYNRSDSGLHCNVLWLQFPLLANVTRRRRVPCDHKVRFKLQRNSRSLLIFVPSHWTVNLQSKLTVKSVAQIDYKIWRKRPFMKLNKFLGNWYLLNRWSEQNF